MARLPNYEIRDGKATSSLASPERTQTLCIIIYLGEGTPRGAGDDRYSINRLGHRDGLRNEAERCQQHRRAVSICLSTGQGGVWNFESHWEKRDWARERFCVATRGERGLARKHAAASR